MLIYQPETRLHSYEGRRILSTTDILGIEGCYKGADFFTPEKQQIGGYAHLACALYDANDLNEESLDEKIRGYVESYKKFYELLGIEPVHIERVFYSPTYGFCSKPDLIARIRGFHGFGIIERKTGVAEQPSDSIQTAGQELAAIDNGIAPITFRGAVYLDPDGGVPSWKPHKNFSDRDVFRAMLIAANWKLEKGLL